MLWQTHTGNLTILYSKNKIIRKKKCPIFHQPPQMNLCFRWKYWKYKSPNFQLKQIRLFFLFIYRWNHNFFCQTNLWNAILSFNNFLFLFCLFVLCFFSSLYGCNVPVLHLFCTGVRKGNSNMFIFKRCKMQCKMQRTVELVYAWLVQSQGTVFLVHVLKFLHKCISCY